MTLLPEMPLERLYFQRLHTDFTFMYIVELQLNARSHEHAKAVRLTVLKVWDIEGKA